MALHAPVPNLCGGGWPVMSSSEIASRDHLEIARALSSSGSDRAGSPLVVARGWRAPERVYSLRGYLRSRWTGVHGLNQAGSQHLTYLGTRIGLMGGL